MERVRRLLRGDVLVGSPGAAPSQLTRRQYVRNGALAGLGSGLVARLWMRLITGDPPVFTVGGTIFILLAFTGMGACAGLALAWRRQGSPRRGLVQRGVAAVPLVMLGPGIPFFLPAFLAGLVVGRRLSRRWRWPAVGLVGVVALFWVLVQLSTGPSGLLAVALYGVLGWVCYLAARTALGPRLPTGEGAATAAG